MGPIRINVNQIKVYENFFTIYKTPKDLDLRIVGFSYITGFFEIVFGLTNLPREISGLLIKSSIISDLPIGDGARLNPFRNILCHYWNEVDKQIFLYLNLTH